jgi:hypothetical protein
MKRGHDTMDVADEMDIREHDSAFKRLRTNEALDLVALQLDKILNYLEVDSLTRESSHNLLRKIIESMQNAPFQENPIYYAGAVVWTIKKLSAVSSSSFYVGRIFSVCEKIHNSPLSLESFISVLTKIANFLGTIQPYDTNDSLLKIEIMHASLSKVHLLFTKIVNLFFKPKSMVDQEKYYEITTYLWIFYCFGRGN